MKVNFPFVVLVALMQAFLRTVSLQDIYVQPLQLFHLIILLCKFVV